MNYANQIKSNKLLQLIGEVAGDTETYVVGGFVRDLAMERSSKDIDVVCVGSGITLAKNVAENLSGKSHVTVFKKLKAKLKDEVRYIG